MTPEAQRIAIAKVCGWTYTKKTVANPDPTPYGRLPEGRHPTLHGEEVSWDLPLPDYLNDLNAMAEAEATLSDSQLRKYADTLQDVARRFCVGYVPDHDRHMLSLGKLICATPVQRAEAILKTLNLWEEQM